MIGRIYSAVVDCPDPRALAAFYTELTGLARDADNDDWVTIGPRDAGWRLAFQRVEEYTPPEWPGQQVPQQFHLDIAVDDVDAAEPKVLALGATRLPGEGDDFRVYADPAGHPFCLVWGVG
jgi:catechol 2,3-dioxygenase-like lactoylglutathione lyase family enzyme